VFIDDVGRIIADATRATEAANRIFELGGPDVMSMNDVVRTALDVMGKRRALLHQPVRIGKAMGALAALSPRPPLTPDAIEFITGAAVADNTTLTEILRPQLTPLREGLASYLAPARKA